MKKITLSDHTNDQITIAEQKRQNEFDDACLKHELLLSQRKFRSTELINKTKSTWAEGRYLAWIASFFQRITHALSSSPSAPVKAGTSQYEAIFQAGADGEHKVIQKINSQLTDDWTVISGYKNPAGEIDILVIGPSGVMAIEVKFINGEIFCDGDNWWRDKYDRYGNLVESDLKISDRGGRTPSVQINASADKLQRFLAERTPVKRVLRTVVLAHDSSAIGKLSSITVDAIKLVQDLDVKAIFIENFPINNNFLVDDLSRIISQDHYYHEQRRQNYSKSSRERPTNSAVRN